MKERKKPERFLLPMIAATRLINLALEHILWQPHGVRVHWTLKVEYFYEESWKPVEGQLVAATGFTSSSGDQVGAGPESHLSGHEAPQWLKDMPTPAPEPEGDEG
jgi:hypothetical protein